MEDGNDGRQPIGHRDGHLAASVLVLTDGPGCMSRRWRSRRRRCGPSLGWRRR